MKNVTEVRYVVTDAFGKSEYGDVRVAYVIGGEDLSSGSVLVFHPKERGLSASVELCALHPSEKYKGKYLFSSVSENSYVNLTNKQAWMYQQMITEAGFEIPKELTVEQQAFDPPAQPKRKRLSRS